MHSRCRPRAHEPDPNRHELSRLVRRALIPSASAIAPGQRAFRTTSTVSTRVQIESANSRYPVGLSALRHARITTASRPRCRETCQRLAAIPMMSHSQNSGRTTRNTTSGISVPSLTNGGLLQHLYVRPILRSGGGLIARAGLVPLSLISGRRRQTLPILLGCAYSPHRPIKGV